MDLTMSDDLYEHLFQLPAGSLDSTFWLWLQAAFDGQRLPHRRRSLGDLAQLPAAESFHPNGAGDGKTGLDRISAFCFWAEKRGERERQAQVRRFHTWRGEFCWILF